MIFLQDLTRVGRPIRDTMLLDDNPNAFLFQPENAIPINSWYDDPSVHSSAPLAWYLFDNAAGDSLQDTELRKVQQLLEGILKSERSAVTTLEHQDKGLGWDRSNLHVTQKRVTLS